MVSDPEKVSFKVTLCEPFDKNVMVQWIDDFKNAGADGFTFHYEAVGRNPLTPVCSSTTYVSPRRSETSY
jgi:hypothetical protein